jgi:hypothetical protein
MPSEDDLVVLEKGEWVSENGVFHLDSDFSSGMLLYNITHTLSTLEVSYFQTNQH